MVKKSLSTTLKSFALLSLTLLICAAVILSMGASKAQAAKAADAQKAVANLVNINSATEKGLEALKGVGPATAKKIVANRPYKSVDELSEAGLSPKAIEGLKPVVTVGKAQAAPVKEAAAKPAATATTAATDAAKTSKAQKASTASAAPAAAKLPAGTKININTADKVTLEKLPEIGPVKAQAIIDGRPYKAPEDIMKVKGIKGKTFETIKDYITVK